LNEQEKKRNEILTITLKIKTEGMKRIQFVFNPLVGVHGVSDERENVRILTKKLKNYRRKRYFMVPTDELFKKF